MSSATLKQSTTGATDTDSPRVLIADKFDASGIEALQQYGCAVQSLPDASGDELVEAVRQHQPRVLVVRSTKVPAAVFEAGDALGLVVRAGAGYDNIDVEAASGRGVFVANIPGKNAIAVAELAFGLIINCDRSIADQTRDLRAGEWDKKGYAKVGRGLYGLTLGVVGLGAIGYEVARRGKAFGMNVIAWSRSLTQDAADAMDIGYCGKLINLAKMADVVSVNVAATPETANLIDEKFIRAMRDDSTLINTSRGSVVDSEALAAIAPAKNLRVGFDVWGQQPKAEDQAFSDPLIKLPTVSGTHHNGASTAQAQQAIADETVRVIQQYLTSGEVAHCVNRAVSSPATTLLTVRHLNQPGVLARVFDVIDEAGINVEEMENVIYAGAKAATARISLDDSLTDAQFDALRGCNHVLAVSQMQIRR